MDISKENKLSELIMLHLQGDNSRQELQQLKQFLNNDIEAVELYVEYMMQFSALIQPGKIEFDDFSEELLPSVSDSSLWMELAKYEMEAPEIEIPKEKPQRDLIQKVVYPLRERRKISKLQIFTFLMSAAAILFFVLFIRFAPVRSNEPIALLSRTVKAQWQDASGDIIVEGCDLYAGPMNLAGGYAEIALEGGAVVVVQAPAQFVLESDQQIYLQEGKVVARKEGQSEQTFLIRTPHASVVDYGTEFGVRVDSVGQTETYVYEGQVQIRDSSNPIKFTESMLLKAGQGASADTMSNLSSKKIDPQAFVRPREMKTRYLAQKGSSYYRWRASIYQLHRDPSLVAHYFFEKSKDNPQELVNSIFPGRQGIQDAFGDASKGTPTWVQGRWPQKDGLYFERAKEQAIIIPSDETLCFTWPLTISTWLYFPNADQWGGHLISCRGNQCINYQFSLFDKNYDFDYQKNRFEFRQYDEAVSRVGFYSQPFIPEPGKWYYAVVVYDGSELRFYVNGELFQAAPYKDMSEPVSAEIVIGAVKKKGEYVLGTGDFDGVVDELMLFNRALSESEIRTIYEDGKP